MHLDHWIVSPFLLQLVLDVLKHHSDHLYDRNDQRTKSQGSRVVSEEQRSSKTIFSRVEIHLKVLPMLIKTGRAGTSDLLRTQYLEQVLEGVKKVSLGGEGKKGRKKKQERHSKT